MHTSLMRGLSPTVSFILLIAIVTASTVLLYYWVVGQGTAPTTSQAKVSVQLDAYNSTVLKITNIDVTNTSSLTAMGTTAGDCTFPTATVLMPGVTYNCSLAAPTSGEVRVWADGVNTATVYV